MELDSPANRTEAELVPLSLKLSRRVSVDDPDLSWPPGKNTLSWESCPSRILFNCIRQELIKGCDRE